MEKDKEKELLGYFLPEGTLEYFDITHFVKDKEGLVLFLEEKNIPPAEYAGQTLHSKGFYPEVRIQDFPIRDNKVELSIKRPAGKFSPVEKLYLVICWCIGSSNK